jgi:hypothetical protein
MAMKPPWLISLAPPQKTQVLQSLLAKGMVVGMPPDRLWRPPKLDFFK